MYPQFYLTADSRLHHLDLDLDLFHSMMGQYKNAIKLANGAHVRSSRANRGAGPRVYILFNCLEMNECKFVMMRYAI